MNTETAHTLTAESARLFELCVKFQALYGKGYRLSKDSPEAAHTLYQQTLETQRKIAALLDEDAQNEPLERLGQWWLREDVLEVGWVKELLREAIHLINICAHLEAVPPDNQGLTPALEISQSTIAGMLHPDTRSGT